MPGIRSMIYLIINLMNTQVPYIDMTMELPAGDLALDDILLGDAAADRVLIRFWYPKQVCVVLGRSTPFKEVKAEVLRAGIPVIRRRSAGGAVVLGPGCLCASIIIGRSLNIATSDIRQTSGAINSRLVRGFAKTGLAVQARGLSDLALKKRNFSGSAQRWTKKAVLHHMTILFDFDIKTVSHFLSHPGHEPAWRSGRSHDEFMVNVPMEAAVMEEAILNSFHDLPMTADLEKSQIEAAQRYAWRYVEKGWLHDRKWPKVREL